MNRGWGLPSLIEEQMDELHNQPFSPGGGGDVYPVCYGDAGVVCPRDEDGIIQPREECVRCRHQRPCLQSALRQQGLIRPPVSESPVVSRVSGFVKRWSDRKLAVAKRPEGGS